MGVHEPKQSSCWYFWPSSAMKVTLQNWQHEIVWPNYRTKWQENTIGPQGGCIPSDGKPFCRQYGLDRYTYWESGIAVEKFRRIRKFLVLLVLVWEYNGLQTQTQQSTHTTPLFNTYLGRIERESESLYPIWRVIAHHLILAPVPTPENLLQIHKAPTKGSTYWHPNRRRITSIALVVSW